MFDAAVLVAQGDFEVEHLLAVADEAERSGLDDARVDGPDVDFVERTALHGVERIVVHRTAAVEAVERKTQRLGPRHAVEPHAVALGDVALEGMECRVQGRERRQCRFVVIPHRVRSEEHLPRVVIEQQAEETQAVAGRQSEIMGHVVAHVGEFGGQVVIKVGIAHLGNLAEGCGRSGVVGYKPVHRRAIWSMSVRSASGCQSPSTTAARSSRRADHERALSALEGCSSSWLGW